jgi:hypothetical protein
MTVEETERTFAESTGMVCAAFKGTSLRWIWVSISAYAREYASSLATCKVLRKGDGEGEGEGEQVFSFLLAALFASRLVQPS